MFKKILIANRGEIAVRVIKTCQRMGIKTVAVYSDADADAVFALMADERVHIGTSPAAESYLVVDKILDAIASTGADAVHPGYGFLSENASFAKILTERGVAFVGPNPHAIEAMGDKITSKKLAADAGVSTVPGYMGIIEDPKAAVAIAEDIGFPVMLKATAGGGGKGMRIARSADEVEQGIISAQNEARSSFGDDRVFIEKYIVNPRHIEIQVLGDQHGNVIHLNERECSIQRRHQKVIEEAPSSFLDEKTRKAMGKQAIALSQVVNYDSAGTVEFIVDQDRNFYFLEMNTRLQVEHPVTELITGVDLVEQMIRSATGEKLSLAQKDIGISGWAMEARIYAEDPYRNFLPSIGRLRRYVPPPEGLGEDDTSVRNDTGVTEGSEISLYYDPMIAKLCTHGPDRGSAMARMADALDEFHVSGIQHNIPFLAAVMRHERFQSGDISTNFIADEYPDGFRGSELRPADFIAFVAVAALAHTRVTERDRLIDGQMSYDIADIDGDWVFMLGLTPVPIRIEDEGEQVTVVVREGDHPVPPGPIDFIGDWMPGEPVFHGEINGRFVAAQVVATGIGWEITHAGRTLPIHVIRPPVAALMVHMPRKIKGASDKELKCPMPGVIISIDVIEGQEIDIGERLAVIEAMKMENVLTSEVKGKVKKVHASAGDSLAVDDVIVEFA